MKTNVEFWINLPVKITKKPKWYLASCPILDVHSQGESREAALKNIEEALSLFFVSCFERGALDEVLKECGFTAIKRAKRTAPEKRQKFISVPIPFEVNTDLAPCHA